MGLYHHVSSERAPTPIPNWKPSRPVIGRQFEVLEAVGAPEPDRTNLHRYAAAYLTAFLVLASVFAAFAAPTTNFHARATYNIHSPISIDGDADLLSQAAIWSWGGTGAPGDPIEIRDYEIDASGTGLGISIVNTSLHVGIVSCYVYSGFTSGIYLENVTNATVVGCIIESCADGLSIYDSLDIIVADTNCTNSNNGIHADGSQRLAFSNVTCGNNAEGVYEYNVTDSRFVNSTFSGNSDAGIWLESCNMTSFDLCHADYNDYGLYATDCYWWMYSNSTCIEEGTEGVYVASSTMFMLANSTFTGTIGGEGVYVEGCHRFFIADNNLSGNNIGAYLYTSQDFGFEDNNITSNGYIGVMADGCGGFGLRNNTCYEGDIGIEFFASNGSAMSNTVVNSNYGIAAYYANDANIGENDFSHNAYGIYIEGSDGADIWNNTCSWNSGAGIYAYQVTHSRISGNNCSNYSSVLLLVYSDYNDIRGNTCSGTSSMGIDLEACNYNNVTSNTCDSNYNGILLTFSVGNEVVWNTCDGNALMGIMCSSGSDGNNVSSNFVDDNKVSGIMISQCSDTLLVNNNCNMNAQGGIAIESSLNATLHQNMMSSNGVFLNGLLAENWYSHTIDQSNIVNGRPVVYVVNKTFVKVTADAGQVLVANSNNVLVEYKSLNDATVGFEAGFSSMVQLNASDCGGNYIGAYFFETDDFAVSNCSFVNSETGVNADMGTFMMVDNCTFSDGITGIFLNHVSNGFVKDNQVQREDNGIWLAANSGLQVWDNICTRNVLGIYLTGSTYIDINNNTCTLNTDAGIYLEQSDLNRIDNNSLADNTFAIYLHYTGFCNLRGNVMDRNGIYLYGNDLEDWTSHTISTTNTANGRPVYYYSGSSMVTVPDDGGQVILAGCTQMTIPGGELSDASVGISLGYSQLTEITDVNCSGGYTGIYMYHSGHTNITKSNMSGEDDCGVYSAFDTGTAIRNCTVAMDRIGVYAVNTAEMVLTGNVFYGNTEEGVYLAAATVQNRVWNNTFAFNNGALGNTTGQFLQAFDSGSGNMWYEPGGIHGWGNYWNEWTTPDANLDGIVDNPYNIRGSAGSRDMFPLVNPYVPVTPIPEFGLLLVVPLILLLVVLVRRRGR